MHFGELFRVWRTPFPERASKLAKNLATDLCCLLLLGLKLKRDASIDTIADHVQTPVGVMNVGTLQHDNGRLPGVAQGEPCRKSEGQPSARLSMWEPARKRWYLGDGESLWLIINHQPTRRYWSAV